MGNLEDRQIAALITGLVALIVVPTVVLAALIFVAGWLWLLGIPGGHGMLFGWLSTKHSAGGHPVWGIARTAPIYFFGVVSAYLAYQATELLAGGFRVFRGALSA